MANFEVFRWNFSLSTNSEIGRSVREASFCQRPKSNILAQCVNQLALFQYPMHFKQARDYAWHFLMRNQGIKEFDDKEFLTRKTDKENKEFTSQ